MATSSVDWTQVIVSTLGAGGVLAGLVALVKSRSETAKTVVEAAGGAVVVQASVITGLTAEISRLRELLTNAMRERDDYRTTVERCERELDEAIQREATLNATVNEFKAVAERLEQRIKELSQVPPTHNAD